MTTNWRAARSFGSSFGIVLLLSVAAAAVGVVRPFSAAAAGDLEGRVRAVGARLVAPCCFSETLDRHLSPQAEQVRNEVRERLAAGSTEDEVVEALVAKYGERLLAAPRPTGFGIIAYLVPPIFLLLGTASVVAWMLRHRAPRDLARGRAVAADLAELDPARAAALRAELARLVGRAGAVKAE